MARITGANPTTEADRLRVTAAARIRARLEVAGELPSGLEQDVIERVRAQLSDVRTSPFLRDLYGTAYQQRKHELLELAATKDEQRKRAAGEHNLHDNLGAEHDRIADALTKALGQLSRTSTLPSALIDVIDAATAAVLLCSVELHRLNGAKLPTLDPEARVE